MLNDQISTERARDEATLAAIVAHIEANGYPPSVRDLLGAAGVKSSSTMHGILDRMVRRGWITHSPKVARSIVVTPEGRDIL